jgi:carbonic anhydrase
VSKVLDEVLAANARYAATFGDRANLPMPPARHFAVLTCMDARMDPAQFAGLALGDAHVIRNAGGRASDDAIRSLVISYKLQGTREWFVIHHTNCGQENFTDESMAVGVGHSCQRRSGRRSALGRSGVRGGLSTAHHQNQAQSVTADVRRLQHRSLTFNGGFRNLRREDRTVERSSGSDGGRETGLGGYHQEPTRTNALPRPSELTP